MSNYHVKIHAYIPELHFLLYSACYNKLYYYFYSARKVLLRRKSNNWDSPTDILQTETRLWTLHKRERKPRAYNNKNEKYWNSDIKGSRAKRRRLSTQMKE